MFKCPGVCARCGRCLESLNAEKAAERKIRMMSYPEDFAADIGDGACVSFDIGTTTVAGTLWDARKGRQIAASVMTNPQREYGPDVISRIAFCGESRENLIRLHTAILRCIDDMVLQMCERTGTKVTDIKKAAVCGNTVMSHLFAGLSPKGLATAPFEPAYSGTLRLSSAEVMPGLTECREVVLLPNISGHVGGDITAGIISSGIMNMKGLTVFIDIGTNGEIVVKDDDVMLCCSTAAGPAFEGASISMGMRAQDGAIEKVSIDGAEVNISTVGGADALGICGSGLIDALAQMLDAGLIDEKGRLAAAYEWGARGFNRGLSGRLAEEEGQRQFVLACSSNCEVVITQKDIREVQLAKGAIKAGIGLLLKKLGKRVRDIDRVVLAGAFGNCIDKASAVRIGLLPDVPAEKIISAGNTAGAGVSMAVVSSSAMELAERIPSIVKHVELAQEPDFQDEYLASMGFGR